MSFVLSFPRTGEGRALKVKRGSPVPASTAPQDAPEAGPPSQVKE